MTFNGRSDTPDITAYGIKNAGTVYYNLSTPALYEEIVRRKEGYIAHLGPIAERTGHHIGRSPDDKFIVREEIKPKKDMVEQRQ